MDRDIVTPSDLFELSQTTFSLGTARSMAMAGAFTSLGADLTSMAINPAGLHERKTTLRHSTPTAKTDFRSAISASRPMFTKDLDRS